jgi:phage shock protein PspC (stress-responsive transcriptional regulator)
MDKFLDKVCDLIVRVARGINALFPVVLGLTLAYFIAWFVLGMLFM